MRMRYVSDLLAQNDSNPASCQCPTVMESAIPLPGCWGRPTGHCSRYAIINMVDGLSY